MNQKNWIIISKVFQIYDRSDLKEALGEKSKEEKKDLQFQNKIIAKMKLRIEEENKQKSDQRMRISFCNGMEVVVLKTEKSFLYQVYYVDRAKQEYGIEIDVRTINLKEATYLELLVFLVDKNIYKLKNISVDQFLQAAILGGDSWEDKAIDFTQKKDYVNQISTTMKKRYEWNHLQEYLTIKAYADMIE